MTTDEILTLPFKVGDLIADKYRMDALLGAGGMGVVLAATHLDLDRKVAVKIIRPELAADEGLVERLLLEARSAAKIRSEHVGKVLDVGRLANGAPYIVMEFLEGQDLGALLERKGAMSIIGAVDLILQACEAVAEAHAAQIVHRDLKPENLFLTTTPDGSPCVKVLDFGISKQLGDSTRRALTNPTTAIGSPQYMAPEQMKAEDIDTRVDVWAMGAILYEAVGGRKAFDAPTLPGVCAQVLSVDPVPLSQVLPSVPSTLEAIVQRCLQKDPNQRYQNIAELAQALAPFGSARASVSYRRIRALGSGKVPSVAQLGDAADMPASSHPVHAAATIKGISRTLSERVSQQPAAAFTSADERRPTLLPVYAAAVAALVATVGIWVWTRSGPAASALEAAASSTTAAPAAEAPRAAAAPGVALVPAGESASNPDPRLAEPAAQPPGQGAKAALSVDPGGDPVSAGSASSARPGKRPAARQRAGNTGSHAGSPAAPPAATEAAGNKAWDPDNFGGRH